ncbi:zinc-binding dehydrogenase [Clostridium sp. AM58-1XD]|nr:zinc-binding dehydrogenase [Clostridium sp. AM58-1XD]
MRHGYPSETRGASDGHVPTDSRPRICRKAGKCKGEAAGRPHIGDLVIAQEVIGCGHCPACEKGEDNACEYLKIIGVHTAGGFAEYVKVPVKKLYRIPDDMDLRTAAMIEPLAVAVHDVRMSGLKAGESVLITGGGPIGQLIAITARASGARNVVISEINSYRRSFAEQLGFRVIDPTEEDFDRRLKELNGGRDYEVSFEVSGAQSAMTVCIDHTANTGTVMVIAIAMKPHFIDTGKIFAKELRLQGVRIHSMYNFEGAVHMMGMDSVAADVRKLISRVYQLDEAEEAFDYAEHGKESMKVVVHVSDLQETGGE